jgi:branched-chain amino acid transport system ATP-binding protein
MKLEVRGLHAGYGKLEVLRGVDLDVSSGQCVAVVGANGAGKSTLLNSIAGLVRPTAGTVTFDGADVTGQPTFTLARLGAGLVPEGRHLFTELSVRDNLLVAQGIGRRRRSDVDLDRVFEIFPVLRTRASVSAGSLSGGEQQMLAIGRILLLRPTLIMLDEPSIGLAPRVVKEVMEAVRALVSQDVGVLLVEQNAREVLRAADHAYVLERGQITRDGPAAEILGGGELRREYLGI